MLSVGSDMSAEKTLLQAALSHLDLALANICDQAQRHELSDDNRNAISTAAIKLDTLASISIQQQQVLRPSVGASDPLDPPLRLPITANKANQLISNPENSTEGVPALETIYDGNQEEATSPTRSRNSKNSVPMPTKIKKSATRIGMCSIAGVVDKVIRAEHEKQDLIDAMHKIMIDGFEDLDSENKFAVDYAKLKELSEVIGCQKLHVQSVFKDMEKTKDGLIYQEEWFHIAKEILKKHSIRELEGMLEIARSQRLGNMSLPTILPSFKDIHLKALKHRGRFILSCQSNKRLVWDIIMTLLLVYVAFSLPLTFAFTEIQWIQSVDNALDWVFTCDLLLNFRTTYLNKSREEIWEAGAIARKYLRTWFLLDFFSSVPLEQLTSGMFPRLAPAKLLKFGKIAKAFKIIRMSKILKIWGGSELMELAEEIVWSYNLVVVFKGLKLVFFLLVMGHWLSCGLLSCGGDAIDNYLGSAETDGMMVEYLVAMYWAMMTMTTVGYGDVAMINDWERLYAICAMIIGGAFYGYIVGSVTTMLSTSDLNQRAFTERMDMVVGWLDNHEELSKKLRRRIWRHFKQFLTTKQAVEDSLILNDLPPQLCTAVSVALLKDTVRTSPMFEGLSVKGLCALVSIITEHKLQADEVIVSEGERGKAMFIVDSGFVHWEQDRDTRQLCPGDSFGEEFLLQDASEYRYTVKTHSRSTLFRIHYDDFATHFKELPHDYMIMCRNYAGVSKQDVSDMLQAPVIERGSASLSARGGAGAISPAFPDKVLEYFRHLASRMDYLHTQHENMQHVFSHLDELHKARAITIRKASSIPNSAKEIVRM